MSDPRRAGRPTMEEIYARHPEWLVEAREEEERQRRIAEAFDAADGPPEDRWVAGFQAWARCRDCGRELGAGPFLFDDPITLAQAAILAPSCCTVVIPHIEMGCVPPRKPGDRSFCNRGEFVRAEYWRAGDPGHRQAVEHRAVLEAEVHHMDERYRNRKLVLRLETADRKLRRMILN